MLAEQFAGINPYQFGANNPIIYNDPTGSKVVPNSILEVSDRQFSMISDALGNLDFEFMNGSSVGGGGGGGGGWGWGSTTQIPGGFSFSGSDAGQWLRGYQNAYNNPNANGDWSFSTGQNQHGDFGYWSSFSFDPGNRGDGHVNLDGVGVGTRFVLSGGEGGGSRSLEESNGWQKTGLVLGTAGVAVDLTENGIKGSQIFANSLSVTKYAIPKLAGLKALSKGFGYAGILITVGDMAVKGINYKNGTEMVFGVISLLPGPGWIIGGIYFIGNYALQQTTGVSIGQLVENIATNKEIGFGAGFNGNVISGGDY